MTINVGGQTFVHTAYALGFDEETDPARQRLADFVADASTLTAVVPEGSLSDATQFVPPAYEIQATAGDPSASSHATEVDWVSDSGITLAPAAECVQVPDSRRHRDGAAARRRPGHVLRRERHHLPGGRATPAARRPRLLIEGRGRTVAAS